MSVRGEEAEGHQQLEHVAVGPGVSPQDRWFQYRINSTVGALYALVDPIGGDWALPRPTNVEVANRISQIIGRLEEVRNRLLNGPPPPAPLP